MSASDPVPAAGASRATTEAAPPSGARSERLSLGTMVAYGLPTTGIGLVGLVFGMYIVKYSTDVLLIAPGVMGILIAASRIWDAVTDPAAGYLSDRTHSRFGRRRSWMAISALPLGLAVVMLWSPPTAASGTLLVLWMATALLAYETAQTAFLIPYGALGVELTQDYHERTRLFGYRHIFAAAGTIAGLTAFWFLTGAEDQRRVAFALALGSGGLLAVVILYATWRMRERSEYQGRGGVRIRQSFTDVVRNPHARLLLLIFGIDTFGAAAILMLIPFFTEYVLHDRNLATPMLACYLVPSFLLTPLWITIAHRISKKKLWLGSMAVTSIAFFSQSFITEETLILCWIIPFVLGVAAGCGAVVAPAITADVIDYDEYLTFERKEGAYLAVWNFVRKCASAVMPVLALQLLDFSGYLPGSEQNESTKLILRVLVGVFPACCFAIGLLLFMRFRFNEREYAEVRLELNRRRAAS